MDGHYIHSSGHLSSRTRYQLHIFGPGRKPTVKEMEALITMLRIDIEILRGEPVTVPITLPSP